MRFSARLLVVAAAVCASSSAFAAGYGMAGCGVGSLVVGDKPGMIQILGSTTNGSYSSMYTNATAYTFATLNCDDGTAKEQASLFIALNEETLKKDMARGQGETLVSFSKVLGCNAGDVELLSQTLKGGYSTIWSSEKTPAQINESISNIITTNPSLAKSCERVG